MSDFVENSGMGTDHLPVSRSKIDRYGFGDWVVQLVNGGKKVREIAQLLTESDVMREAGDSISHEAVSLWIRKNREEQAELRKMVAEDLLRESMGADISVLDKLANRLLEDFDRDFKEVVEDLGLFGIVRKQVPMPYEMRVQVSAELRQLIATKQKLSEGGSAGSHVSITLGDLMHGVSEGSAGDSGDG